MNSRQRLLGALRRAPIDRVPISTYELCGYNSQSFENREDSYRPLMDFIRAHTDAVTMWNPPGNGGWARSAYRPEYASETTQQGAMRILVERVQTPAGRTLTATQKIYDGVHTVWHTERLCKDQADIDAYMSIPFVPVKYDFSDRERILRETGTHGIIMTSLSDPVCTAMELMAFGEATVWALTETDHFKQTLDELHRRGMINLENMLKGGVSDLYRICGPEYLTPPYLPPPFFERFVMPYVTDMTALIHRYGGLVRIHSHGKIGRVLDYIAACGADAIDPCEAPPDGDIALGDVKARLGGRMCLFGNLQLKLLEHGSTDAVKEAVKEAMDAAKGDTGYVIMPTAAPINVPLSPKTDANYRTFIETALELGRYA